MGSASVFSWGSVLRRVTTDTSGDGNPLPRSTVLKGHTAALGAQGHAVGDALSTQKSKEKAGDVAVPGPHGVHDAAGDDAVLVELRTIIGHAARLAPRGHRHLGPAGLHRAEKGPQSFAVGSVVREEGVVHIGDG